MNIFTFRESKNNKVYQARNAGLHRGKLTRNSVLARSPPPLPLGIVRGPVFDFQSFYCILKAEKKHHITD